MWKLLTSSAVALIVATGSTNAQTAAPSGLLDAPDLPQLEGQDIDPNQDLLDILIQSAMVGPKFELGRESISITMEAGDSRVERIRITNVGDNVGVISGINSIGSVDGLTVSDTCKEELPQGQFCEISISFASDDPQTVQTAVVLTMNERQRKSMNIPIRIEVKAPPVVEPVVEQDPTPIVIAPPAPVQQAPKGPTSQDIARQYYSAMGGMQPAFSAPQRGFVIVSGEKPKSDPEIAGVGYEDVSVETIYEDPRYDESIPYTDASLPVNRDRILTTDRVIKAILETPVSNVMCNKTVALVESDVYSATSSRPLIPAGSRIIGECQQFVDERVGIAWTRIITTDGRSISFDAAADTNDAMGLGGAIGRVYQSNFDKYVLPIFSTMIDATAGVILATFGEDEKVVTDSNGNITQERSAQNEGIRIVTGEARSTTQDIIRDIRDVRKIAVIPKGSRIDIEINEDIYFGENRKIVRVADMTFDLNSIKAGSAQRSLPEEIRLVPAGRSYDGPTVNVAGQRYRIEERAALVEEGEEPVFVPIEPSLAADTLSDLAQNP
jgi:type IV secretory pathway VirB10-like protein